MIKKEKEIKCVRVRREEIKFSLIAVIIVLEELWKSTH